MEYIKKEFTKEQNLEDSHQTIYFFGVNDLQMSSNLHSYTPMETSRREKTYKEGVRLGFSIFLMLITTILGYLFAISERWRLVWTWYAYLMAILWTFVTIFVMYHVISSEPRWKTSYFIFVGIELFVDAIALIGGGASAIKSDDEGMISIRDTQVLTLLTIATRVVVLVFIIFTG